MDQFNFVDTNHNNPLILEFETEPLTGSFKCSYRDKNSYYENHDKIVSDHNKESNSKLLLKKELDYTKSSDEISLDNLSLTIQTISNNEGYDETDNNSIDSQLTNSVLSNEPRDNENNPIKGNNQQKSSVIVNSIQTFINYICFYLILVINSIETVKNIKSKEDLGNASARYIEKNYVNKLKSKEMENLNYFMNCDIERDFKAIKWYTKECFVYRMINEILREQNYVDILAIRYFIFIFRKQLKELSSNNNAPITLFRGTCIPAHELKNILNCKTGNLILLNGFLSTSREKTQAEMFSKKNVKGFQSVMMIFHREDKDFEKYASVKDFSCYQVEDEYIIDVNHFFKIIEIEENKENKCYNIHLKFARYKLH